MNDDPGARPSADYSAASSDTGGGSILASRPGSLLESAQETYVYRDEPSLDCPITAIAGIDDLRATAHEIEAWERETRVAFSVRRFPGGHFFFRNRTTTALRDSEVLAAAWSRPSSGLAALPK